MALDWFGDTTSRPCVGLSHCRYDWPKSRPSKVLLLGCRHQHHRSPDPGDYHAELLATHDWESHQLCIDGHHLQVSSPCAHDFHIRPWILTTINQCRPCIPIRMCPSEDQGCLDQHVPILAIGRRCHGSDLQLGHTAVDEPLGLAAHHCDPDHHPDPHGHWRSFPTRISEVVSR